MPLPTAYTVTEVAEALKVSAWWVKKQVRLGVVSPMRLSKATNGEMRFTEGDVQQLVRALTPAPAEPKARRRRNRVA